MKYFFVEINEFISWIFFAFKLNNRTKFLPLFRACNLEVVFPKVPLFRMFPREMDYK